MANEDQAGRCPSSQSLNPPDLGCSSPQNHTLDIPDRGTSYNVVLGFFLEVR